MTTELFLGEDKRPLFERILRQASGDSEGTRPLIHNEKISKSVDFTTPGKYDPTGHKGVVDAKKVHVLGMWVDEPKYAFVPGPGILGRTVTLHVCWAPPGHLGPKSESEFGSMPGYQLLTFGGLGDPGFNREWSSLPFSTSRHRVIFSNTIQVVGPMVLYWAVESKDVGDHKGTGALFYLRIEGKFEVFGNYF